MLLKDLKPNPKNPRTITDAKLDQLKKALTEFGDLGGVVYNARTEQLIGGHQRSKLFSENAKVVIERHYDTPTRTGTIAEGYIEFEGERFRYRQVDWDVTKEKLANLAANKGAGDWDQILLAEWFTELGDLDVDLDLSMFDVTEIEELLAAQVHPKEGLTNDNQFPEKVEPRTKLGDLYLLGSHRLLCGDSTDKASVERLMGGEKADICFTSPPYNAGNFEPTGEVLEKFRKDNGKKLPNMTQKYANDDDNKSEADYTTFLRSVLVNGLAHSETIMLNIGLLEGAKRSVMQLLGEFQNQFKDIVYWNKKSSTPHIVQGIMTMIVEPIFCFGEFKSRKFPQAGFKGNFSNLIEGHNAAADNEAPGSHSATFPVYLPLIIAENFSKASVLDLFMGTGTTMIACEKLERKCFGMELDPHYMDIAIQRWEDFTGKKALLVKPKIVNRGKINQAENIDDFLS